MKLTIKKIIITILTLSVIAAVSGGVYYYIEIQKCKSDDPLMWESDILEFEKEDKEGRVPADSVLFVGSSSFRFWKSLKDDMAGLPVINRGFGGAKVPDLIHYADRIILPCRPKILVVYCGENDMSVGRRQPVEEVFENTKKLFDKVRHKLPAVKIFYVSIKPSPSRMKYWPAMNKVNVRIKEYMLGQKKMFFVDVSTPMFKSDGTLKEELFVFDRIHMNSKGYEIWTGIIKPLLEKEYR